MLLVERRFLKTVLSLLRPKTFVVICLNYIIAIMLTSYHINSSISAVVHENLIKILLGLVTLACWYINATSINDLADFEIDKINLQKETDRPLVNGQGSKKQLIYLATLSLVIGSVFMYLISWRAVILYIILIIFNYIYSMPPFKVSYRGGLAQILLPMGYVLLPYLLGVLVINEQNIIVTPIVMIGLYLIFCARVLLKDFRDVKGDKKYGKNTFLLRHSVKTVANTSKFIYSIGIGCLSLFIFKNTSIVWMIIPLLFMLGVNLAFFNELSKTSKWSQQKPLLPTIGRLITAQIIIFLLTLFIRTESINIFISVFMAICITITFFLSAVRNYQFLISRT